MVSIRVSSNPWNINSGVTWSSGAVACGIARIYSAYALCSVDIDRIEIAVGSAIPATIIPGDTYDLTVVNVHHHWKDRNHDLWRGWIGCLAHVRHIVWGGSVIVGLHYETDGGEGIVIRERAVSYLGVMGLFKKIS